MSLVVTHAFVSPSVDGPDATKLRPSNWGSAATVSPTHVLGGGSLNALLMRNTGVADGASWTTVPVLTGVVVGGAVAPNGVEGYFATSSASDPRGIMSAQYSSDAIGARLHLRKARNTEAAPAIVVSGDVLGRIRFSGYDGAAYPQMASIDVVSAGTIAANRVPTQMAFSVATDAAPSVLTEVMRLRPTGVYLNNPAGPGLGIRPGAASNVNMPLWFQDATSNVIWTFFDSTGGLNTVGYIRINGNQVATVAADGTPTVSSYAGSGVSTMLDIVSDVVTAMVVRAANASGAYLFQGQDRNANYTFSVEENGDLMWGAGATKVSMDTVLHRDSGADILAMVRGTNQQTFRIYGTTTGSKYLQLQHDGVNATIGGAPLNNNLSLGKLLNFTILGAGHLALGTHNTYDLGASPSSQALRNIFVGGAMCQRTKAGTPVDGDVANPTDGMLVVDTTANKIWVRIGAAWKGVVVA